MSDSGGGVNFSKSEVLVRSYAVVCVGQAQCIDGVIPNACDVIFGSGRESFSDFVPTFSRSHLHYTLHYAHYTTHTVDTTLRTLDTIHYTLHTIAFSI